MKKDRLTREKEILPEMIKIYCNGIHKTKKGNLCNDCQALLNYSIFRLDHCRWGNDKTFCSQCPCHCYKSEMREKIKEVMRYSGPRMMFYHPIICTMHLIETIKGVIKEKNKQ